MAHIYNLTKDYDFDIEELRANGPDWKAGDYLIVEYLDLVALNALGEKPESDGVVRLWLADDSEGTNQKRLIDIKIGIEDRELIKKATLELSRWADGFYLAATLRRRPVGIMVRPYKKR